MPQDVDDIRHALMFAEREQLPVSVIGGGNNMLVKDRGVRGVVLRLEGCLGRAEFHGEEAIAGAGVSLSAFIREAAAINLGGIECLVGIPATIGGALAMNAGPCAIENLEILDTIAGAVKAAGANILRGGAFKPRTSPYSFQGMKEKGLQLLAEARAQTGLAVVTEVMAPEHVPLLAKYAGQPFFGYVAFTTPHFPLQAPAEDIARYRDRYTRGWDVMRNERWQRMRQLGIGGSVLSAGEPRVHFGLGSAAVLDRVRVRWPDGREQEWRNLGANECRELSEISAPPSAR